MAPRVLSRFGTSGRHSAVLQYRYGSCRMNLLVWRFERRAQRLARDYRQSAERLADLQDQENCRRWINVLPGYFAASAVDVAMQAERDAPRLGQPCLYL